MYFLVFLIVHALDTVIFSFLSACYFMSKHLYFQQLRFQVPLGWKAGTWNFIFSHFKCFLFQRMALVFLIFAFLSAGAEKSRHLKTLFFVF